MQEVIDNMKIERGHQIKGEQGAWWHLFGIVGYVGRYCQSLGTSRRQGEVGDGYKKLVMLLRITYYLKQMIIMIWFLYL